MTCDRPVYRRVTDITNSQTHLGAAVADMTDTATVAPTSRLDRVIIRFAGDSGDGMQLTGDRFTSASALFGNDLATLPEFPAEIRAPAGTLAGVSAFQVHISDHDITTPGDAPERAGGHEPGGPARRAAPARAGRHAHRQHRHLRRAQPDQGRLRGQPARPTAASTATRVYEVPMTSLTKEAVAPLGVKPRDAERSKNFFALGLISWMYTRPDRAHARRGSTSKFAKQRRRCATPTWPRSRPATPSARRPSCSTTRIEVKPAPLRPGHLHEHHRQHRAGVGPGRRQPAGRACRCSSARYPITPASDILHELSKHKNFGVRTLQAEDEIAGIGAALGAAFGGHLGVTTTSGPGVALKAETMGLAVSLELPLLIIDIQRGGPVHRPAHQDRGGRPAAWPCTAATASRRCRSSRPTARPTASTPPSRRPASPSSTARR